MNDSDNNKKVPQKRKQKNHLDTHICIFCGAESDGTNGSKRMIISEIDNLSICFDCAKKCFDLVVKQNAEKKSSEMQNILNSINVLKPKDIKKHLDDFVIGQDKAKMTLAVAIYNHYKKLKNNYTNDCSNQLDKSNILLIGNSGTGKCVTGDTFVTLRNKITGEIKRITIDSFIKNLNTVKENA